MVATDTDKKAPASDAKPKPTEKFSFSTTQQTGGKRRRGRKSRGRKSRGRRTAHRRSKHHKKHHKKHHRRTKKHRKGRKGKRGGSVVATAALPFGLLALQKFFQTRKGRKDLKKMSKTVRKSVRKVRRSL